MKKQFGACWNTYIVLELSAELAKIKVELEEMRKQLSVTHLSLINEMRHNEKSYLGTGAPFQHKYPFQNLNTKNSFPHMKLKFKKKLRDHFKNHRKNN